MPGRRSPKSPKPMRTGPYWAPMVNTQQPWERRALEGLQAEYDKLVTEQPVGIVTPLAPQDSALVYPSTAPELGELLYQRVEQAKASIKEKLVDNLFMPNQMFNRLKDGVLLGEPSKPQPGSLYIETAKKSYCERYGHTCVLLAEEIGDVVEVVKKCSHWGCSHVEWIRYADPMPVAPESTDRLIDPEDA